MRTHLNHSLCSDCPRLMSQLFRVMSVCVCFFFPAQFNANSPGLRLAQLHLRGRGDNRVGLFHLDMAQIVFKGCFA